MTKIKPWILFLVLFKSFNFQAEVANAAVPPSWKTFFQSAYDSIQSHCVYTFSIRTHKKEMEGYKIARALLLQSQTEESALPPPEASLGIDSQQAIRILSEINPEKLDFSAMKRVGINRLFYMRESKSGFGVYLKESFERVELGETKPQTIRNQVRFEPVGFALDRYLGFSFSPPAYQLSRDLVAILEIPGAVARDYKKVQNDLRYFRQIAWISVLDSALFNGDRINNKNILELPGKRLLVHDFDRSEPKHGHVPWALESRLWVKKIKWEFPGKKPAFYDVPLLLEPQYFERLLSLTPEKFDAIIAEVGVNLLPSEKLIVVGTAQLLGEIFKERWVKAGFSLD